MARTGIQWDDLEPEDMVEKEGPEDEYDDEWEEEEEEEEESE